MNSLEKHNQYFASANGYYGFKSYFNDIFNPEGFTKIFVLKGGPGTGKSTFIKRLIKDISKYSPKVEEFVCSSDCNSLDGMIARWNDCTFAVLDGTAPHERDAIIPGAIDEIVNLGECFDTTKLESVRNDIILINKNKAQAYKEAYRNLENSSFFNTKYEAEISKGYNFAEAKSAANKLLAEFQCAHFAKIEPRVISSFSKSGYRVMTIIDADPEQSVTLLGERAMQKIFMKVFHEAAISQNKCQLYFPNCLSPNDIDALRICDTAYVMTSEVGNAKQRLSTEQFADLGYIERNKDYLNTLLNDQKKYEDLARLSFEMASEYHFMLEEIYTPAVDFLKVDELYNRVFEKIISIIEARNCH